MDKNNWMIDCRSRCKRIKYISDHIIWAERPNHSGWLGATSVLLDERRVAIPELFFKGEFRPGRLGDSLSYALMYRHQSEVRRVFMLEVYPDHVRSHKEGDLVIFGPHIHLGDYRLEERTRSVIAKINEAISPEWVERFRRHARILNNGGKLLEPPFADGLFS
jgi:hypothetical protein